MEDFYNAMTTYINSKKPKCQHERTFYWQGWRTCVECRLCIYKVFSQDPYSNVAGYNFTKPKEERFPKIRKMMNKMIRTIIATNNNNGLRTNLRTGEIYDVGHLKEALVPDEIFDYLSELSTTCFNLEKNTKCHSRSLCAALLWKKVKSLYPDVMTLIEFSKRVGVSVLTIIKTCEKIKLIGSNYIIKDNGKYKSQTNIGSRTIPEANGFAHWG